MAILSIFSNNSDLGWVLNKNPNTISEKGPYKKPIRKGVAKGWFQFLKGLVGFHLYFQDHPSETSFGGEFEYLDQSRYSSPAVIIALISNCLRETLHGKTLQHEPESKTLTNTVSTVLELNPRTVSLIYKTGWTGVSLRQVSGNSYQVSSKGSSVYLALNTLYALCILAEAGKDQEDSCLEFNKASMTKILGVLSSSKAPYRVVRRILTRTVNNRVMFSELAQELSPNWSLKFGNNQIQRLDAIRYCIENSGIDTLQSTLVDLGCGELYNSGKLASKFNSVLAVDGDAKVIEEAPFRAKKTRQEDKFTIIHATLSPAWIEENSGLLEGNVVLLTEVLEHNKKQEAVEILKSLLKQEPGLVVVTVPNKGFNSNYGMDPDELRHEDHKWEPTKEEMNVFLQASEIDTEKYEVSNPLCADEVDGEPCFLTFSIRKK